MRSDRLAQWAASLSRSLLAWGTLQLSHAAVAVTRSDVVALSGTLELSPSRRWKNHITGDLTEDRGQARRITGTVGSRVELTPQGAAEAQLSWVSIDDETGLRHTTHDLMLTVALNVKR